MGRLLSVVTIVCFGLVSLYSASGADPYADRGHDGAVGSVHDRTPGIFPIDMIYALNIR